MEDEIKSKSSGNVFDINSSNFNPDIFLKKKLKENSLKDIMDEEQIIVSETQRLHSEMQTLVYENYNKFISATDTIKNMKRDFKQMETEMDLLASNMNSITSFSDQISNTLHDSREKITKLSNIYSLLQRLQFLYKLPNKLSQLYEEGNYAQAVDDYLHTQQVLNNYAHLESFHGIQTDCLQIVEDIKTKLKDQFKNKEASAKDVTVSVELLLKLGEPTDNLYSEIISHANDKLSDQLEIITSDNAGQDLIEFVDIVNNGYLSDLCLFVTSYNDMFASNSDHSEIARDVLIKFMESRVNELMEAIEKRFYKDVGAHCDSAITVRALDKLYSKLSSSSVFDPSLQLNKRSTELISNICKMECNVQLGTLEEHLAEWVRSVRQALAVAPAGQPADSAELLTSLVLTTVEKLKTVLHDLTSFIDRDISFSQDKDFLKIFTMDGVYTGLSLEFLRRMIAVALSFVTSSPQPSSATLLILAKMCLEFHSSHVNYLLNLTMEYFWINDSKKVSADKEELCKAMHDAAQQLVNHYVKIQGNLINQMIRKSVETREWGRSVEPRTPRAVVRRVVEEIAAADSILTPLFPAPAPAPSSDSSRHRPWSNHSLHHVSRIFSEKVDLFSPVQFDKTSILTGVIKINLKTLLECVRLRTFNKFGLQQIQVDTHYLQLYLWKYVSDENIIHSLLDEILGSAVHRCLDPILMEPSVVEILCERG